MHFKLTIHTNPLTLYCVFTFHVTHDVQYRHYNPFVFTENGFLSLLVPVQAHYLIVHPSRSQPTVAFKKAQTKEQEHRLDNTKIVEVCEYPKLSNIEVNSTIFDSASN